MTEIPDVADLPGQLPQTREDLNPSEARDLLDWLENNGDPKAVINADDSGRLSVSWSFVG